MAESTTELLYLEDLHVGRRFTSGPHALDERQITGVAVVPSRSGRPRGIVTVRSETKNQRGEIVQETTVKLLVPRRSNEI